MTGAQSTYEVYAQLGVLNGCKSLATRFDRNRGTWVITGKFQDENGIRFGKVAEFDNDEDAIDFVALTGL